MRLTKKYSTRYCGGTKATVKCTTPRYIIADLDIPKNAPLKMIKEICSGNIRDCLIGSLPEIEELVKFYEK